MYAENLWFVTQLRLSTPTYPQDSSYAATNPGVDASATRLFVMQPGP